jgi:hypothetical protein
VEAGTSLTAFSEPLAPQYTADMVQLYFYKMRMLFCFAVKRLAAI